MNLASKLALTGLTLALAACSTLEGDKVDYKGAAKAPSLAIPPDLTQLPNDNRYATPGLTVSATGYQTAAQGSQSGTVAVAEFPGIRLERAGNQRWLVVDMPAEQLWPQVKDFWQETGFALILEQPQLGIMETDWAENRAKLPEDFIRRTLGKLLDNLFSTGELDKFRTRLERNAAGGTEIYISHRGLEEVFRDEDQIKTAWQPRPSDAELEVEMLRRLMVRLGVPQEQSARQVAAAAAPKSGARLLTRDGQPQVQLDEAFDRAWRRVGLTLDRTGFTVEDRDRSQGTYYVRYVEPRAPGQEEPGFFARLFGAEAAKPSAPQKYRILVRGEGERSTVTVLNEQGQPEASDSARRILQFIAEDLR